VDAPREVRVKTLVLVVVMAAAVPEPATPAPHPDLAWALAYELPAHDCKVPDVRPSNNNATRVERFRRQAKRYTTCVKTYQEALLADYERIRLSAGQGVDAAQAEVLESHLGDIAARIKSLGESIELVTMSEMEAERLANQGARQSGAQYP
jgi:hypothetical protein